MSKYDFFYLTHKIEVQKEVLTGAEIKAAIKAAVPDFDLTFELILEGHGHDPDKVIGDTDPVSLSHQGSGVKHFYGKPPTNFGVR